MPSANAKKDTGDADEEVRTSGLLFELENLAVAGRKITFDVLKSLLADKDIEINPALFSRYCLRSAPQQYVPVLLDVLDRKKVSAPKVAAEVTAGINVSLEDNRIKTNPALSKILAKAKAKGLEIGALTGLDEAVADKLMDRLGLKELNVTLYCAEPCDREFPTADAWLKLAKSMSIPQVLCTALSTGATSCKAALSAGMRCAVLPDEFTSFQDFGGADLVVDEFNDKALARIVALAVTEE